MSLDSFWAPNFPVINEYMCNWEDAVCETVLKGAFKFHAVIMGAIVW